MPCPWRVERTLDEQGPQQEPQGEDASTNFQSVKTHEETPAHLTNGHPRGGIFKHEKSITEKSTTPPAPEKTGGSMPTEKVNGSASQDKGKKARGEPPFTKQEREEMEALLDDLCGHLGQSSKFQYLATPRAPTNTSNCQSSIQLDFWKAKTSRTTFCSTPTECSRCQFTTEPVIHCV